MTIDAIRDHPPVAPSASILAPLLDAIRQFFAALKRHSETRRAERALETMDAKLLHDIGIHQSAVMSVLYLPPSERSHSDDDA